MERHHQRLKVAHYSRSTRDLGISTGCDAIPYAPHVLPTAKIKQNHIKNVEPHMTQISHARQRMSDPVENSTLHVYGLIL